MEDRYMGLDQIHPDLTSIMKDAESGITEEAFDQIGKDFETIEETMWNAEGDPDGDAQLYVVTETVVQSDNTGLVITPFGNIGDDVYTMLKDPALCKQIAEQPTLGLILRCGGKARPTEGEEGTSEDVALTVLVCGTGIFAVTRLVGSGEIVRASKRLDHIFDDAMREESEVDGLSGMGRLADQMILSYVVPPLLKKNKPDVYELIVKNLS